MTTIPWKMFSFYVRVQGCGFCLYKPLTLSSLEHSFCLTQMCISWTALLKTTNRLLYLQLSALFWLTISHLACYVRKQKDFFPIPLFLGDFTKMICNCILFSINNGGSRFLYKKGHKLGGIIGSRSLESLPWSFTCSMWFTYILYYRQM